MVGPGLSRTFVAAGLLLWVALTASESVRDERSKYKATRLGAKRGTKADQGAGSIEAVQSLDAVDSDIIATGDEDSEPPGRSDLSEAVGEATGWWRRRRYGRCHVPGDTASTRYSECNGANARRRAGCNVHCKTGFSGGSSHVVCHHDGNHLSGSYPSCADIRRRRTRICNQNIAVAGGTLASCATATSRRRTTCAGYCLPGFALPAKENSDNPGNQSTTITCEPSTMALGDSAYARGNLAGSFTCKEVRRRRSKVCTYPTAPNTIFESCRQTESRRRQTCRAYCAPGYSFPTEAHKDIPMNTSVEITCRPGSEDILETAHPAGTYDSTNFPPCTEVRRRRSTKCNMPFSSNMTDWSQTFTNASRIVGGQIEPAGTLDFSSCKNVTSRRRTTCNVTCSTGWRLPTSADQAYEPPTAVTCEPATTDLLDNKHHAGNISLVGTPICVTVRRRRTRICTVPGLRDEPAMANLDFGACSSVASRRRSNCTVSCAFGFVGNSSQVTCMAPEDKPGRLNETMFPACPPRKCALPPPSIEVNHTSCSNVSTHKICRETCNLGYSEDGKGAQDFTTKLCNPNGVLLGPNVSCQPNTCANRQCSPCSTCLPAGSCSVNYSSCANTLTHQNCTATCSQGYTGNATHLACDPSLPSGPLFGVSPTCTATMCQPPVLPVGVDFRDCLGKRTTELCTARCKLGYWQTGKWTNGSSPIRCSESGKFTGHIPVCSPKPCFPLVPNKPTFDGRYDPNARVFDPRNHSSLFQAHRNITSFSTPISLGSHESLGVDLTHCKDIRTHENCTVACYPGFGVDSRQLPRRLPGQVGNRSAGNHSAGNYSAGGNHSAGNHSAVLTCAANGLMTGRLPQCKGIPCHQIKPVVGYDFDRCAMKTTTQQCRVKCMVGPPGVGYIGNDTILTCGVDQKYLEPISPCTLSDRNDKAVLTKFDMEGVPARSVDESFDKGLNATLRLIPAFSHAQVLIKRPPPVFYPTPAPTNGLNGTSSDLGTSLSLDQAADPAPAAPLEVKMKLSGLNRTSCHIGVGNMKEQFDDGSFASELGKATGFEIQVSGLEATVVDDGPTDSRSDPFAGFAGERYVKPASDVPNAVNRMPGITEINVQGTYDRATGQWHKASQPNQQSVQGSYDRATGQWHKAVQHGEISSTAVEGQALERSVTTTQTQDLEYLYADDWQRVDDRVASIEDDLEMLWELSM